MCADRRGDEPAAPDRDGGLIRLRIELGYDGTNFVGWARQPGLRSVQATVEDALVTVMRLHDRIALTVAGRTDAGVHARGQVAHVDIPVAAWSGRARAELLLARILPPDIRIASIAPAAPGFDARFAALSRLYRYRVCDDPRGPDPLVRAFVWWRERRLDGARMNEAAATLIGLRDFAAFCRHRTGASTVRTLLGFSWRTDDTGLLVATVEADAFCHSMVRALVGALIPVGEGRRPIEWPASVLAGLRRDPAVNVAPAHGLTLESVQYPPAAELSLRTSQTRRPRRA